MSGENKKTILLVEDEVVIAMVEKFTLEKFGYNVITANTGEEAVDTVEKTPNIDLILMDIELGAGMDGTEAAAIILQDRDIPVVFLSAHTEPEIVAKTEKIASYGYLVKNSSNTVLQALIKIVFKLFEAKKEKEKEPQREAALEALRESEEKYRTLVEKANEAIIIVQDSVFVFANRRMSDLLGVPAGDLEGKPFIDFVWPEDRELVNANYRKRIAGEAVRDAYDFRIIGAEGRLTWISLSAAVIQWKGKIATLNLLTDITERKQAEALLQQERELYLDLVNNQPVGIYRLRVFPREQWQKDAWNSSEYSPYSLELVNDRFCEILGINRQVFETNPGFLNDLIYIEDKAEFARKNEEANVKLIPFQWEGRLFIKGKILWVHFESLPRPVVNGDVLWMGTLYDITEHKQAESQREAALEALRESEERYRTLFENTGTSIIIIEEDATISLANEEFARRTGYTRSEIEGVKRWTEIVDREDIERMVAQHQLRRESPGDALPNYEFRYRTKSGELRYALINVQLVPGTRKSMASIIDITKRKRGDEEIKRQLAEKEILLKEVHHRIKNNIASIGGLLSLHVQSATNPEAIAVLQEAIGRVNSMRILYDKLLLSEDYQDISVKNYLDDLIDTIIAIFPDNAKITLDKRIADFHLDSKRLFPLGIIINELLTNIMKYAFTNRDTGLVKISLTNMDNRVALTIQDNGIGLPVGFDINEPEGFGLKLVKMLIQQLGGSFSIKKHAGTRCKIEFNV